MSTSAFFGNASPRSPEFRLHPLSPVGFVREAAGDVRLLGLLAAYEAESFDSMSGMSGLPSAKSFGPERLLALGMTARAGFLSKRSGVVPPAMASVLTRAAAGPQLHCRPARFRLGSAEVSRLLLLLPLGSCEQSEVVEILMAFGL